ncbi:MAG: hypothetical protein H7833_15190, partial [Magnetococcus sp. DMHC-1]
VFQTFTKIGGLNSYETKRTSGGFIPQGLVFLSLKIRGCLRDSPAKALFSGKRVTMQPQWRKRGEHVQDQRIAVGMVAGGLRPCQRLWQQGESLHSRPENSGSGVADPEKHPETDPCP